MFKVKRGVIMKTGVNTSTIIDISKKEKILFK